MNIIWSPLALERVSHTVKYIALDNPQAALNWENSIFEMVERFKEHPKSCEN